MELRGCPMGKDSTQECFDQHELTFIEDVSYEMPAGECINDDKI